MQLKSGIPATSAADKAAFFDGFFEEFQKVPFGSMSKRDMECLLIKLMYGQALIDTASSRRAANALGVNETRLKGCLVDTRCKFRPEASLNRASTGLSPCSGAGEGGKGLGVHQRAGA